MLKPGHAWEILAAYIGASQALDTCTEVMLVHTNSVMRKGDYLVVTVGCLKLPVAYVAGFASNNT